MNPGLLTAGTFSSRPEVRLPILPFHTAYRTRQSENKDRYRQEPSGGRAAGRPSLVPGSRTSAGSSPGSRREDSRDTTDALPTEEDKAFNKYTEIGLSGEHT